ncbi:hypothetical protein Gpo141_00014455 [Globisporangium polare]
MASLFPSWSPVSKFSAATNASLRRALFDHLAWLALLLLLLLLWFPRSVEAIEKVGDTSGAVLSSTGRVRVGPGIAAVLAILVGFNVCLFGYRLLRPVIFVCGFLAGGLLMALIVECAFGSMAWVALASWIGFLTGGALSGYVVLMLYDVGLFIIGALAGSLLAFTLNTALVYRVFPSQLDVMLVILVIVLGIVGGLLVWRVEKPVIILATSFIGADAVVWGVGYFAGKYPSRARLKQFHYRDAQGHWFYSIPSAWWGYLVALVLLFLFGVYWQFHRSGKGVDYSGSNGRTPAFKDRDSYGSITGRGDGYRRTVSPARGGNPVSYV